MRRREFIKLSGAMGADLATHQLAKCVDRAKLGQTGNAPTFWSF